MNRWEIEEIAEKAADEAVRKMLLALGVDANDARETQKDMAFVRQMRLGTSKIGWGAFATLCTIVVGGLCSAVWLGIKAAFPHS